MLNLKKTALAVIALGSTAAFAGTMGPVCSAVNVTVPCENTAWDIGGRALYLQPTTSAFSGNRTITNASTGGTISREIQPGYGWGFQLEASYHYSTGNDFDLNWYHFRNGKTYQNNTTNNFGTLTGNGLFDTVRYDVSETYAYQSNSTAWDQVNMEFGQHVDFGENKFGRLHAGMNYSRVGNDVTTQVIGAYASTPGGARNNEFNSYSQRTGVYNGFGPRVGMDLGYDWGNGLSVYGNGALSVLAGTSKTSYNPVRRIANGNVDANNWYSYSNARVVPELDAKLGFMYTYAMAQGDLSFDIGWLWAGYMGAISSEAANLGAHSENFGVQGLYFGLKWVGNVA